MVGADPVSRQSTFDCTLNTDDPTKWDYVFRNFEASAAVMGLHTNWHKTKIQNIGTGVAPRTVHIDNQARQYPGLHTWALT